MNRQSFPSGTPGRMIVFNGASSSGKTTLCRALLPLFPSGALLLSVDDFLAGAGLPGMHLVDALHQKGPELIRPFHDGILRAAMQAPAVLVDHVIGEHPDWLGELRRRSRGAELLVVKVACSPAELARREHARTDRKTDIPHALRQHAHIHEGIIYDLETDTTFLSPEQAASRLAARLLNCPALTTTA